MTGYAVNVERAVAALARGQAVVVTDDASRENEGDLVLPAATATPDQLAMFVRHTSGIVCVPMTAERADRLALPPMVAANTDPHGTAFTVSVDHCATGTGVSASDRARTVRALADPATAPDDLRRPGHVFPLRARAGGVLVRPGHTEAAVDLLGLAGLPPVGVIAELVTDGGGMAHGPDARRFATRHELTSLTIADLVEYRLATEPSVERMSAARLPTPAGEFLATCYRGPDGSQHLALTLGDVAAAGRSVLVRLHSECLTGEALGSLRCDCGPQLRASMDLIAAHGCGVVVYLRGHEGRGIGLADKLRAYALQDKGYDTVDANTRLGLPVDARDYRVGAGILAELGVRRVRLITDNPAKAGALARYGLTVVERVALPSAATEQNLRYLRAKRDRLGHLIGGLADLGPLADERIAT